VAKRKQSSIRILNPVNGCAHTSHKNARRYVELKQARYGSDERGQYLEFIWRAAGYEWPSGKVVTVRELLNIGVVRPEKAITGAPALVARVPRKT